MGQLEKLLIKQSKLKYLGLEIAKQSLDDILDCIGSALYEIENRCSPTLIIRIDVECAQQPTFKWLNDKMRRILNTVNSLQGLVHDFVMKIQFKGDNVNAQLVKDDIEKIKKRREGNMNHQNRMENVMIWEDRIYISNKKCKLN